MNTITKKTFQWFGMMCLCMLMIQSLADTMYIWEADSQQVQTSNKMAATPEKTIEEIQSPEFMFSENQHLHVQALNPAQTYQLVVYSLDGKVIVNQTLSNQVKASCNLSTGFYIARLSSAHQNILTQKFLIP